MQLSIIIVNYNVKYFVEQCLHSVLKAIEGIHSEVFVVDNASKDGSIEYLQPLFPRVNFIASKANDGFAKANNKALALTKGEYVLFLNPDTIVPEDCFKNCISFFKQHEDCGALGVQMIDGSGNFLPESKRAFPGLSAAFYKLSGLSILFPKSSVFNKYALGNLNKDENYSVDVLAGAFMMLTRKVVSFTKGFDESYFMYGEDIDLSYKVQQAGFKNYYFGKQNIIHFKGESTKRGSLNYVRIFYKAMIIFVKKHYTGSKANIFNFIINIAIWFRAVISIIQGFINKTGMILIDSLAVSLTLFITKNIWEKYIHGGFYYSTLAKYFIPIFTVVFLFGALISGIYDNLYKPIKAFVASLSAVVVMLAVYSLMPEEIRFSRGVILIGGLSCGIVVTLIRWIFIKLNWIKDDLAEQNKQMIIVGSNTDFINVLQLMGKSNVENNLLGRVGINDKDSNTIGNINDLESLSKKIGFEEIIFCEGNITFKEIIHQIELLKNKKISFRFHSRKSNCVIGSDFKTSNGEILIADGNYNLASPYQKRMKRMIDIWISFFLLFTIPIQYFMIDNATQAIKNAWLVMIGKRTWIGYSSFQNKLPLIEHGILTPNGYPNNGNINVVAHVLKKADIHYAKEFDWITDLKVIVKNYRSLGEA